MEEHSRQLSILSLEPGPWNPNRTEINKYSTSNRANYCRNYSIIFAHFRTIACYVLQHIIWINRIAPKMINYRTSLRERISTIEC